MWSTSGETKLFRSITRKFYVLHMNNIVSLAIHGKGREGVLLMDGLSTPLLRRDFVDTEWSEENAHPPATGQSLIWTMSPTFADPPRDKGDTLFPKCPALPNPACYSEDHFSCHKRGDLKT
ncbi:hypothetical protein E2C01_075946 [Portunus trituberculatus]|uniref:Uncharacterized protein n=1 Tax=Portunus trituberculatus TaxID=210409 RepID=A0A5B7IH29_PORTR|nr:hypothetical protein [Portunus trituberculatus]